MPGYWATAAASLAMRDEIHPDGRSRSPRGVAPDIDLADQTTVAPPSIRHPARLAADRVDLDLYGLGMTRGSKHLPAISDGRTGIGSADPWRILIIEREA
jgi:hypothetical protein